MPWAALGSAGSPRRSKSLSFELIPPSGERRSRGIVSAGSHRALIIAASQGRLAGVSLLSGTRSRSSLPGRQNEMETSEVIAMESSSISELVSCHVRCPLRAAYCSSTM